MNVKATIYVERGEEELELVVTGRYSPGDPGQPFGPVERCYAPTPEEVDLEEVLFQEKPWEGTLTKDERSNAEEALCDAGRNRHE